MDAILDVRIAGFGFLKEPSRNVFVPWIVAPVQLVSRDGKTTFYRDCPIYGSEMPFIDAFSIPADRKFFFRDFDAVVGDPERAVQGLQAAVTSIASRVGQQLKAQESGIYFFRKGSFSSGSDSYTFKLEMDGKVAGYLNPKQCLYVPTTSGHHKIRSVMIVGATAESLDCATEIEVESGKDSYFQTDFVNTIFRPHLKIVSVPEAVGRKAVKAMKGS